MFKNLIPWKQHRGQLAVHRDEPIRQQDAENHPLAKIRQEFDSLLNRFFDEQWFGSRTSSGLPSLWDDSNFHWNWDLGWEDKGNEYIFNAELPGFEPEDFDVKVSGNVLTVHAEHKEQTTGGKNGNGYRYGSFTRTFTLPHGADDSKIDARYHSGVLELHLPKTEEVKSKRIEVKSG